ncbi:cation transporting ATPase C-terminal domain-containing protein [Patescibacteria group bacterium]|nr:cation transporting ATPase C-terminal domain-containing protein [Patescibacteria group bacterium]
MPVTTAQILWINLVSDGFPSLALTLDPKRK